MRCDQCHTDVDVEPINVIEPTPLHGDIVYGTSRQFCSRVCVSLFYTPRTRDEIEEAGVRAYLSRFPDLDVSKYLPKGGGVMAKKEKLTAIYHVVRPGEDFHAAAQMLMDLVRGAQEKRPGQPRGLYLDIEGHRVAAGGFDQDMFELQTHFVLDTLAPFLTEINMPLGHLRRSSPQNNDDIPDDLVII